MRISKDTAEKIKKEYDEWVAKQYCDQDLKTRQKRGAFYTPPEITIMMLKKFKNLEGTICDPCLGIGGLIAAAIIAGADPKKCYGIELDPDTLKLAKERLGKMGVPESNLVLGNALEEESWKSLIR